MKWTLCEQLSSHLKTTGLLAISLASRENGEVSPTQDGDFTRVLCSGVGQAVPGANAISLAFSEYGYFKKMIT